jgi:hypothetical protein
LDFGFGNADFGMPIKSEIRIPKSEICVLIVSKPLNINVLALIPRSVAQTVVTDLNIISQKSDVTGR